MEDKNKEQPNYEIPEEKLEELRRQAKARALGATHNWKQKGGWVKCSACDFPHGLRVQGNQIMTGINEIGMPIFRT